MHIQHYMQKQSYVVKGTRRKRKTNPQLRTPQLNGINVKNNNLQKAERRPLKSQPCSGISYVRSFQEAKSLASSSKGNLPRGASS